MANNADREKAARTPIGDIVNETLVHLTAAQVATLESDLTLGDYVARVTVGTDGYVVAKWYLDEMAFTTFKSKDYISVNQALTFLQTMIDISTGVVEPVSVAVSPATATIAALGTQQLTAVVTPAEANQEVYWSSSDVTKATVDADGLVTGVATGEATITGSTKSGPVATDTSVITIS